MMGVPSLKFMSVPSFDPIVNNPEEEYTIRQFQDDIASPNPSFKARFIERGVDLVCTIHKNTPAAWLADGLFNDGKVSVEHLLLDDLCRPRNQLPPSPTPQFNGGQCDGKLYFIDLSLKTQRGANQPDCDLTETSALAERGYAYGPISGIRVNKGAILPGSCQIYAYEEIVVTCKGTSLTGIQPLGEYKLTGGSAKNILSIEQINLRSADGSPVDQCGSPAAKYPPALPTNDDLTRTAPFQITPTLNVPVTVTVNPTLRFNPTVIAPVIAFNVGGLNVNYSLGGFTFSPTYSPNTNNNFPNTTNPTSNPIPVKNRSKHCADDIDVLEIINRLDRIGRELEECCERDRPYPPPDANKVLTTVLGSGNSGGYDLPPNTFQIALRISTQPLKGKQQDGYDAPDVLYSGWAWFGAANNLSERMPVDSQFKLYSPPRYISNAFYFTLYNGVSATITAYSIKPKPTPP